MPDTPSPDSTPSQEPIIQGPAGVDAAKALRGAEIRMTTTSQVHINPLDQGLTREKDAELGLEM